MTHRSAWVLVIVCLFFSAASFAALTPGQQMAVDSLIKQFSAADFATRQKAVDRLIEMGPDVVPQVKKALADTMDNEVKLRCQMVLKALGDQTPAAAAQDKTAREASKVTFDFKNTPLAEVVDKLAELSGNKPFHVDDTIKDMPVTLAVKDLNYWEAVDKAAAPLNLIYTQLWLAMGGPAVSGLQLVEAEKDAKLTGYAGPAVVKVDAVTKYEPLRSAKMGMTGFTVALSCYWEDRLDPLTEEVELTKVQTPKGESLLPQAPEARTKTSMTMGTPFMKLPPCMSLFFNGLPMPAADVRSIAELSGIVRLEFATGEREVRIDDVLNAEGKVIKVDDWTITVKKVDVQQGMLTLSIEAKYKDQPVDVPTYWTRGTYGWFVEAGAGGKRTRGGMSMQGGAWGRPQRGNPGNPGTVARPQKKGEGSVLFQGNYEAGATSVVLVLPKTHETKEYPFTIRDIPLP